MHNHCVAIQTTNRRRTTTTADRQIILAGVCMPPPAVEEVEEDASPPPMPLWGNKKPPTPAAPAEDDDDPPPVPLWNKKKPEPAVVDDDDDMPPPAPLWGNKKKVQVAEPMSPTDGTPPSLLEQKSSGASTSNEAKPKRARGSVLQMGKEAVAKAIGRRKAFSVHISREGAGGETTLLRTVDREYELGATLGHGAYATVRHCTQVGTGEVFAVKVFKNGFLKRRRFSMGQWTTNLDGVYREIAIMKQLTHPQVMRLHDVTASDNHLYMVMDFCPRGAIMDTEKLPQPPLAIADARKWFADSVLGLQYLHFQGVIHHDLKPDNILVSTRGSAMLADFGVSRAQAIGPQGGRAKAKGSVGTPLYNAPEKFLATSAGYDGAAADVWALGVTLHAMVFGDLPFPAAKYSSPETLEAAITGGGQEWACEQDGADEGLLKLLAGMICRNPAERFTLATVHDAPFCAADIAREEFEGGGGSFHTWSKIEVNSTGVKAAVGKGKMLVRTQSGERSQSRGLNDSKGSDSGRSPRNTSLAAIPRAVTPPKPPPKAKPPAPLPPRRRSSLTAGLATIMEGCWPKAAEKTRASSFAYDAADWEAEHGDLTKVGNAA